MANRKRNSRGRRFGRRRLIDETPGSSKEQPHRHRRESRQLEEQWQTLHSKIGLLEDFITGSIVREEKRRRLKSQGILPPPERSSRRTRNRNRKMTSWEEEHYYGQRERNGLAFLFWFAAVSALLWWLMHSANL